MLRFVLTLLAVLPLLSPPGLCLCQAVHVAEAVCAGGNAQDCCGEPDAADHEEAAGGHDDSCPCSSGHPGDHDPVCPAKTTVDQLGIVKPTESAAPVSLLPGGLTDLPELVAAAPTQATVPLATRAPDRPLFLTLRALRR